MLPNPDHAPAAFTQYPIYATVTSPIIFNFSFPERAVPGGHLKVLWASMPKTAVNKNSQTAFPKKKIRSAENILMPAPTLDAVPAKYLHQNKFSVLVVFALDGRHQFRSHRLGKEIGHALREIFLIIIW